MFGSSRRSTMPAVGAATIVRLSVTVPPNLSILPPLAEPLAANVLLPTVTVGEEPDPVTRPPPLSPAVLPEIVLLTIFIVVLPPANSPAPA